MSYILPKKYAGTIFNPRTVPVQKPEEPEQKPETATKKKRTRIHKPKKDNDNNV